MTATSSPMVTTNPQQTIASPPRSAPPQEVASDLLLHRSLVNTYALRTEGGLLLIDSGLTQNSQSVYNAVRTWSQAPLHTAIYTRPGHNSQAARIKALSPTRRSAPMSCRWSKASWYTKIAPRAKRRGGTNHRGGHSPWA